MKPLVAAAGICTLIILLYYAVGKGAASPEYQVRRLLRDCAEWIEAGTGNPPVAAVVYAQGAANFATEDIELVLPPWTSGTVGLRSVKSLAAATFTGATNLSIDLDFEEVSVAPGAGSATGYLRGQAEASTNSGRTGKLDELISVLLVNRGEGWKIDRVTTR